MTPQDLPRLVLTIVLLVVAAVGLALVAPGLAVEDAEEMSAFTATGQENGTIVLDDDHDDPIEIPACDGDEPLPEQAAEGVEWEEACVQIDADVDGTDWSADGENVTFPTITDTDPPSLASEATVEIDAPDGLEGTIDPDSGEFTLEGTLSIVADIDAPLRQGDVCETETELAATTNESGELEGEPIEGTNGTVVDNEFAVPGFDEGSLACDGANDAYGLPSDSGESYFELEFELTAGE